MKKTIPEIIQENGGEYDQKMIDFSLSKNVNITSQQRIEQLIGYTKQTNSKLLHTNLLASKGKNKGRKKKIRAWLYKMNWSKGKREFNKSTLDNLIKHIIPKQAIARETQQGIYILCPFHKEKTASMMLSKERGICKCYGCGKSIKLEQLFEILFGETERYRHKIIFDNMLDISQSISNQLILDLYPEDTTTRTEKSLIACKKPTPRFQRNTQQDNTMMKTTKSTDETDDLPF